MSKNNENYSSSFFARIENFVNGVEDTTPKKDNQLVEEDFSNVRLKIRHTPEELRAKEQEAIERSNKFRNTMYPLVSIIIGVVVALVLFMTVSYMPAFGRTDNPVNNEVPARYIEHGMQETGTVNVVTGLILNYRGFDTMGETHVLFIAASTVMILLLFTKKGTIGLDYKEDRASEPKDDVILKKVATFLVPIIAVFGIYVVLNGHISPGGGFSGGSILGAGLILYVSAFGFKKTEKLFNEEVYKVAKVSALCCYVCCLSYYFFCGANGLDNHIPLGTPGMILSSGLILFIDIFVGTEVACTMYAFYALFRRGEI